MLLTILKSLFGRRTSGFGPFKKSSAPLGLDRQSGGGVMLGSLVSLLAPYVVRKLMDRRAQRAQAATA